MAPVLSLCAVYSKSEQYTQFYQVIKYSKVLQEVCKLKGIHPVLFREKRSYVPLFFLLTRALFSESVSQASSSD